MHDFLTEVAKSSHFFCDDIVQLADLILMLQKHELRKDIIEVLQRAADALRQEDLVDGLAFLLYAQRLSPSNRPLTLFIGDLRLAMRLPEAAEAFEFIVNRSNWRGAWYRLALTRFIHNQYIEAAANLHEALAQNAPIVDIPSCNLATNIACSTSALGWCGVNNYGILFVGGPASSFSSKDLEIKIDETIIKPRPSACKDSSLTCYSMPKDWIRHFTLKVNAKGVPLIGSPIKIQSITRTEGFVRADETGILGWAWFPGEPDARPVITVENLDSETLIRELVADPVDNTFTNIEKLAWPRRFSLAFEDLPECRLRIRGPHRKALYGSPLNPWGTIRSGMSSAIRISRRYPAVGNIEITGDDRAVEISIPATHRGIRSRHEAQICNRAVLVVIPVYRGFDTTVECIDSVVRHQTSDQEILVISDASPDEKLIQELEKYSDNGTIVLLLEKVNKGFPGTVNIGLRKGATAKQDVILLNSDTIVTAGWVAKLRQAVYHTSDVGTATPLSNAATILSYPCNNQVNIVPTNNEVDNLAEICANVNGNDTVDIPTAHGFCMYIKYECLEETGLLRDETFAQGYGEENDFCMRARHLGWRHVAVPGSFIGHVEGQSFAAAKDNLVARNLEVLNALHPGYDSMIAEWQKADPLSEYRRRIDWQRWIRTRRDRPVVCFVTHDREGGVLRHVQTQAEKCERDGFLTIICKPGVDSKNNKYCEIKSLQGDFPNLKFRIDTELDLLRSFFEGGGLSLVEVHHFIGHDESFISLVTRLGIPYDVHIHDYSWFCPRITLTSLGNRYCGEPPVSVCVQCVSDLGSNLGFSIPPDELIAKSQELFSSARRIIFPSEDTARRFRSRFDISPVVTPWETSAKPLNLQVVRPLKPGVDRKICIAGAIGYEKGYDIILECARMAAQKSLPIEFRIVGFTCDDERLLQTGKVKITGRYDEKEAVQLIKDQGTDFAFLPALWPETWSYVVSQLWEAQLPIVAFDIGAPSERIKARDGGFLLPLGMPVTRILQLFLSVGVAGPQSISQVA